jgi:hypothetical protein
VQGTWACFGGIAQARASKQGPTTLEIVAPLFWNGKASSIQCEFLRLGIKFVSARAVCEEGWEQDNPEQTDDDIETPHTLEA